MADGTELDLIRGTERGHADRPPRVEEALREYRAAHHLTQAALGGLLGVDQTYVSMIERGRRQIRDIGFLARVARVSASRPPTLACRTRCCSRQTSP